MAIRSNHDAQRVLQFGTKDAGPRRVENQPDQPTTNVSRSSDITVRSFHLLESGALGSFPERVEFSYPESSFVHPGAAALAWRRIFQAETTTQPIYIALDGQNGKRLGAMQCRQQPADERWHLQFMALAGDDSSTFDISVKLLEHAIAEAGSRGARRLLASVDVESAIVASMRAVDFSAYSRESVYLIPDSAPAYAAPNVRSQRKSDVWAIHQLYLQSTPRDVQNAEALTSHAWDVDSEGRSQRGWYIARENTASAFIRVRTSRHYHVLDLMAIPENRDELELLLGTVLAALRQESARPIYLLVRRYQADFATQLEASLADPIADQFLMVKYTTALMTRLVSEPFELLRPVESDPQRVPSFCVRDIHEQC